MTPIRRRIASRSIRLVVAVLGVWLEMPDAAGGRAGQPPIATPIQALVTMYRRGDNNAALTEFLKWDEQRVAREAKLPADAPLPDIGALVLMHTSAALAHGTFGSGSQLPLRDRTYYPTALDLVNALSRRARTATDDPDLRAFCRDWYILVVSLWSAGRDYQQAGFVASTARSRLGDDARLLLAAGSAAEATMEMALFRGRREPNSWSHPAALGASAVHADEWLARAVKLDPTLVEARLRRGRVLYLFSRISEARKELERALADAAAVNHTFAAYLSAMFLGELLEHGGQLDEARAAYEKAIALHPDYPAAHLALGQLLVAAGKPEQGWAAARRVFGDAANPRNPDRDPWCDYQSAQFWQAQELVKGMFEWVRR